MVVGGTTSRCMTLENTLIREHTVQWSDLQFEEKLHERTFCLGREIYWNAPLITGPWIRG